METRTDRFVIAQFSDIHCGDPRFDPTLMSKVIDDINAERPDLVIVPGDLTATGYPDEFELARDYIDRLDCPNVAVLVGNHDARKVGYELFEAVFDQRHRTWEYEFGVCCGDEIEGWITVIGLDSSKPDLDDGEVGRHRQAWLSQRLAEAPGFKVVALHHHLVSIPGTGRERNIVWDAGEVLEILAEHRVDLVIAGHKHVPYVWPVADTLIVTSGTAATWRTRGFAPPSYNVIEITAEGIAVEIRASTGHAARRWVWPRVPREGLRRAGSGPKAEDIAALTRGPSARPLGPQSR